VAGIYEIDAFVRGASKLKTFTVVVDHLVPKSSKRKNPAARETQTTTPEAEAPPSARHGPQPPAPAPAPAPTQPAAADAPLPPASEEEELLVRSGRKVAVTGFTIESRLQMALSDPVIKPLLLFGEGRTDGIISEFRDTPFAKQPNKYSEFNRVGTSFGTVELYDDFAFAYEGRTMAGRAIAFRYVTDTREKEIYPVVRTMVYVLGADGRLVLNARAGLHDIRVPSILRPIAVAAAPAPGAHVCSTIMTKDRTEPFDPVAHQQRRVAVYKGDIDPDTQLWVSIFYDSYTSAPTRYKSVGGLYMTIMNMELRHQKKLENVFLLSLVPSGADYFQVWEEYRRELVRLQCEGFEAVHADTGRRVRHKVRLSNKKADSPQRCKDCDHSNFCPRCAATRADIWNFDFRVLDNHYHAGFVAAVHEVKRILTPELFAEVRSLQSKPPLPLAQLSLFACCLLHLPLIYLFCSTRRSTASRATTACSRTSCSRSAPR